MITARRVADGVRLLKDSICDTKIAFEECSLNLGSNHESGFSSRPDLGGCRSKPCEIRDESSGVFAKTSVGFYNKRDELSAVSVGHSSVTSSFLLGSSFSCSKGALARGLDIGN